MSELFSAWLIGAAVTWPMISIGIVLFVQADKKYQAEKLAKLRAEGLYWPESVDSDLPHEQLP